MSGRLRATCRIVMGIAGSTLIASTVGMLARLEPFHTWYYLFAWWAYILFLESLLHLRGGRSELFGNPWRFLGTLPLSILFWLVFELFNFRLQNWHYSGVPEERDLRWAGYALSFATVLPGLQVTVNFLDRFTGLGKGAGAARSELGRFRRLMIGLGIFCLLTPLIEPRLFFPLIWIGFILILDPVNHGFGAPSLLGDMEAGSYKKLFQLPVAGLCCGLLWETWNYWAGGKWTYTIPFLGFLRVFEMPMLGFLGFPPFALEAFVMGNAAFLVFGWVGRRRSSWQKAALWLVLTVSFGVFSCLMFSGIDRFTVTGYRP
jgi:hypothetical protein